MLKCVEKVEREKKLVELENRENKGNLKIWRYKQCLFLLSEMDGDSAFANVYFGAL